MDHPAGRPFDHVLLTRFSAVMVAGAAPAPPEWLDYRLGFFYDACLPSVTRQRGADFSWLVLLDDRCSDTFREQVEELADGAFTPIWSSEPFGRDTFARHVTTRSDAEHLITTRIDSDDAMAVDLMARVQEQFDRQERLFVNFPRGIQIDRTGAVYRSDIASGPFLSLIERRVPGRPPETVYVAKHARARGHAPLRQVRAPVMWAQVVHGTNVSNIVNGRQVDPAVVRQRFDLDLTYDAALRGPRLRRAQAAHARRLGGLWARHPGEFSKWLEATAVTARGTRTWAQSSGVPFSEHVEMKTMGLRQRVRNGRFVVSEKVNSLDRRGLHVVAGDSDEVLSGDRVVILAEWSSEPAPRPGALRTAEALALAGWPTLIVSARDPWVRLRTPELPAGVALARRPNSGYDFGSWRDALAAFPHIATKDRVLLMNDSHEGPAGPLDELVRRMEQTDADLWGVARSPSPRGHLFSYLLLFTGGVLAQEPLRGFFAGVTAQRSKKDVINTYEFALTSTAARAGLRLEVGWTAQELDVPERTVIPVEGWAPLMDAGFPFVKRFLLTDLRYASQRPAIEARLAQGASG